MAGQHEHPGKREPADLQARRRIRELEAQNQALLDALWVMSAGRPEEPGESRPKLRVIRGGLAAILGLAAWLARKHPLAAASGVITAAALVTAVVVAPAPFFEFAPGHRVHGTARDVDRHARRHHGGLPAPVTPVPVRKRRRQPSPAPSSSPSPSPSPVITLPSPSPTLPVPLPSPTVTARPDQDKCLLWVLGICVSRQP